jgi:hypothetical protein
MPDALLDRYQNDAVFHALVDASVPLLTEGGWWLGDLQEVLQLAEQMAEPVLRERAGRAMEKAFDALDTLNPDLSLNAIRACEAAVTGHDSLPATPEEAASARSQPAESEPDEPRIDLDARRWDGKYRTPTVIEKRLK